MICVEIDGNGIVLRAIMAESLNWCATNLGGNWMQIISPYDCSIGWTWDGERFMPPETEEVENETY